MVSGPGGNVVPGACAAGIDESVAGAPGAIACVSPGDALAIPAATDELEVLVADPQPPKTDAAIRSPASNVD
jgi:hypothetical protein